MSTDKSLKQLKSKDKFLITNVSNYFEKKLRVGQLSIYSTDSSGSRVSRRTVFKVRKEL